MFLLSLPSLLFFLSSLQLFVQGEWVKQMENKELFEGDIVLTPDQQVSSQNGYTSISRIWPKTIHYDWAPELANNSGILAAITDYEKYTCLRFKKRTNERNYVYFFRGNGCSSNVGMIGGRQTISLGRGCTGKGTVIHEIGHSIGIYHEQSRSDRDDYVIINYENIQDGLAFAFKKLSPQAATSHGTVYDFRSIMHYGAYAFSKNGKPTIVTKDPANKHYIGNRYGFSDIDLVQINRMYKCNAEPSTTLTPTPRPPEGSGFVLRHSSGKCVAINSNNQLYLTSNNCNTKFSELNGGTLKHASSRRCVQKDGDSLRLQNECSYKFEKAFVQGDGSFSIRVAGKTNICVHPRGGSSNPEEGTILLTWGGCGGKRLKFTARFS